MSSSFVGVKNIFLSFNLEEEFLYLWPSHGIGVGSIIRAKFIRSSSFG
jgi:hypothetical protein